jgi:hypothetical protein
MVWAAGLRAMPTCPGRRGPAGAGEEDKVSWLGLAGARDGDPGGTVGHHGQARAVVGAGRPVLVGLAELGFGEGEDFPGGAGAGNYVSAGLGNYVSVHTPPGSAVDRDDWRVASTDEVERCELGAGFGGADGIGAGEGFLPMVPGLK